MTKNDILSRVKRGEMQIEDAEKLLEKLERINLERMAANGHPVPPPIPEHYPPMFKVAEKSGWCSVYFQGMWRPCTLPSALWLELLETENVERFKKFLEENKNKFRNKER